MKDVDSAARAWKSYLDTVSDWKKLVEGVEPQENGCGWVYELPNPIDRPNESIAVADMGHLKISEPHYHPNGAIEIYIVLEGQGLIVVGTQEQKVQKGSVVITPTDTTHFSVPDRNLVLAVINLPPFKPENYVVINETNQDRSFDQEQFARLAATAE